MNLSGVPHDGRHYDATRAYALSKLANVFHTKELARRLQAAATTCYVATHPRLLNVSGKYFADCNETSTSKLGSNSTEAARLWAASEFMISRGPKAAFDLLNHLEF
ncbi:hypothetical protein JHK82_020275 [Glycine max]|nr:hypothetical protein JHK85_020731 [Glycine max]KAG5135544.1 hypothetical protein JHK82_020275 [Glycine max]